MAAILSEGIIRCNCGKLVVLHNSDTTFAGSPHFCNGSIKVETSATEKFNPIKTKLKDNQFLQRKIKKCLKK